MSEIKTCARCNRQLKTEKSQERGFGPVCYSKHIAEMEQAEQGMAEHEAYLEWGEQQQKDEE